MDSSVEIETGIPSPDKVRRKYPHAGMEVGESFCVPLVCRQNVYNANTRAHKRTGFLFTSETREEKGETVVRVWRVK